MSFEKLLNELISVIDESNIIIIDKITDPYMQHKWMCIKPDLTYEAYYSIIKQKWDFVVNKYVTQSDMCESIFKLLYLSRLVDVNKLQNIGELQNLTPDQIKSHIINKINNVTDLDTIFEPLAELIISKDVDVYLDINIVKAVTNFLNLMSTRSICFMWDALILIATHKFHNAVDVNDKHELANFLKSLFLQINNRLKSVDIHSSNNDYNNSIDAIVNKLTGMHSMTIESELNRLIPDKLASLKSFFIKTITYYYDNIHPIVWMQIIREIFINFLKDPPLSEDELFQFFSKHLLMNSGPFILKILQQVRPAMPLEMMKKYNLTKLTYPVMTPLQYNLILSKVVKNWNMYEIDYDKSASVGHVFIVHRSDNMFQFVVKIAKPLSIAQSCWEYWLLNNLFPDGTCEQQFVHNMLSSVRIELYSPNEVNNVKRGNELYTMDYSDLFKGTDLNVKLTTVSIVENVIVDNCWFAFAMSKAPGIAISSLIEGEKSQLLQDTLYRAVLHRCIDLLVYKFFINIFQHGFYHGDLHAGNIYFDYETRQMTLIDFGAVGTIDIYSDDPFIRKIIDIFVMSIFFNYDNLLDAMTELLNEKCSNDVKIDMESNNYKLFKKKLKIIKIESIFYNEENQTNIDQYKQYMFGEQRLIQEKPNNIIDRSVTIIKHDIENPYEYIDIIKAEQAKNKNKQSVTDNTQSLPYDFANAKSKIISFAEILAMITEFYATSGVNIAIKFAEFYDLLKAYVLIIGVLSQVGYPQLRTSIIMGKMISDPGNLQSLLHIKSVYNMYTSYKRESEKFNEIKRKIQEIKDKKNL